MDGNAGRMGISRAAVESATRVMDAVKAGHVKKHLMGNTSPIRYGTMEKKEMMEYRSFVKTKLCYEIMSLTGDGKQERNE